MLFFLPPQNKSAVYFKKKSEKTVFQFESKRQLFISKKTKKKSNLNPKSQLFISNLNADVFSSEKKSQKNKPPPPHLWATISGGTTHGVGHHILRKGEGSVCMACTVIIHVFV